MSKQRGLGRGFDSLIPTQLDDQTAKEVGVAQAVSDDVVLQVSPADIKPNPHQPRSHFDDAQLADLSASIREHGVLQPLVVTKAASGSYELIAGERRLRASKLAGLKKVPVIVRSFGEQQKLELAIIENVQRAQLNPVETALAYQKLADEFNLSLDEISKKVGKAKSTVSNMMRLLQLPESAQRAVAEGVISEAHGRAILALSDADLQHAMLEKIVTEGLNVRQAEQYSREVKQDKEAVRTHSIHTKDQQVAQVDSRAAEQAARSLSDTLGLKVTQQSTARGGKIIIHYQGEGDLQRIEGAIQKASN